MSRGWGAGHGGPRCHDRAGALRETESLSHLEEDVRHHPLLAYCDNTGGEPLAWMLRKGSAGSNTAADHIAVVDAAIAALPPACRRTLMVTVDGAGFSHKLIEHLDKLAAPPRAHSHSPMRARGGCHCYGSAGKCELDAGTAGQRSFPAAQSAAPAPAHRSGVRRLCQNPRLGAFGTAQEARRHGGRSCEQAIEPAHTAGHQESALQPDGAAWPWGFGARIGARARRRCW
jgi:hypothetical protein